MANIAERTLELRLELQLFTYQILGKKIFVTGDIFKEAISLTDVDLNTIDKNMYMSLSNIIIGLFINCEFYKEANWLIDIWGIPKAYYEQTKGAFYFYFLEHQREYVMKTPLVNAVIKSNQSSDALKIALRIISSRTFVYKIDFDIKMAHNLARQLNQKEIYDEIEKKFPIPINWRL